MRIIFISVVFVLIVFGYLFVSKTEVFAVSMTVSVDIDGLKSVFRDIKKYAMIITHNSKEIPKEIGLNHVLDSSHEEIIIPIIIPTNVPNNIPTVIDTVTPTIIIPTEKKEREIKLSIQSSKLLSAVNDFRLENGKSAILQADSLCGIAQSRLNELKSLGNLDHHEGFSKYFETQKEFNRMGETIYQSSEFKSDGEIVSAWEQSEPHKAILLEPLYTHGCGARSEIFAVFIIATR